MAANWKPWHKVVELRPDLLSGELPMSMFAADLHEAFMQNGRHPIYENPAEFFSLTFPTASLRKLAGEVCERLLGQNDKAVRQLQLTYGGGKTHALIALMHLGREAENLPSLPAVEEFRTAAGARLPKARVAALCFDKIDPEAPVDVKSPTGEIRQLKQPWSILAWQIGGQKGLAAINPENPDRERETTPFQEVLGKLLAIPGQENLGLLILIDEVLMYAHAKVRADPGWRGNLKNFFQCLTQAVSQSKNACLVASLLASDASKEDLMGKSLQSELYEIFNRQREEAVEPVGRDDVAEVLRRRFFVSDSIRDPEKFRSHVQAALKGVFAHADLDDVSQKRMEERFYRSYPFHPDLTDIFFSKWTQIRGYQKTRGALRTFALALRDSEKWDQSPVISTAVFLNAPDAQGLSAAARELVIVADNADETGPQAVWTGILEKELEIAKDIQTDLQLGHREIEQAAMGTFLHSQPLGQDAKLRDLTNLAAVTRPDKINFRKGLEEWANSSFWLDDEFKPKGGELPTAWRLGRKPNLTQMHNQARAAISPQMIEDALIEAIRRDRNFTNGVAVHDVRTHLLPRSPAEVQNDGQFHYVVLGPECAGDIRNISREAKRYLEEGASENSPRTYRNALIMIAPSLDGLEIAKNRIRDALAWNQVLADLRQQGRGAIDPARESTLAGNKKTADGKVQEAIRQAWSLAVVMSEKGQPQCFKFTVDPSAPHFNALLQDPKTRISDEPINAEAILPGGPYDLWHEGDRHLRVQAIYQAFVKYPHLPKLLKTRNILETIKSGCEAGLFVLRLSRPDGSSRTWWMTSPDANAINDPELEIWLPEYAELSEINPNLLEKGKLEGLWPVGDDPYLTIQSVSAFFNGNNQTTISLKDYEESVLVPKASSEAIIDSLKKCVQDGKLWLYNQPASITAETVEDWMLNGNARFYMPPSPISPITLLPDNLPEAWNKNETNISAIESGLAQRHGGRVLPWNTIKAAISAAINGNFVVLGEGSVSWPCSKSDAGKVRLVYGTSQPSLNETAKGSFGDDRKGADSVAQATLSLNQLIELGEQTPELLRIEEDFKASIKVEVVLKGSTEPERREALQNVLSSFLQSIQ